MPSLRKQSQHGQTIILTWHVLQTLITVPAIHDRIWINNVPHEKENNHAIMHWNQLCCLPHFRFWRIWSQNLGFLLFFFTSYILMLACSSLPCRCGHFPWQILLLSTKGSLVNLMLFLTVYSTECYHYTYDSNADKEKGGWVSYWNECGHAGKIT